MREQIWAQAVGASILNTPTPDLERKRNRLLFAPLGAFSKKNFPENFPKIFKNVQKSVTKKNRIFFSIFFLQDKKIFFIRFFFDLVHTSTI